MLHFVYILRTLKDDATIGQRIAFHRRRRKLLGRELAKLAHIGRTTLIRYETDQLECPYDAILRIAKVLDVDKRLLMDDYLQFIDYPYYNFIKQRRKELGLRQIDLGNQIGINRKTIQKWENHHNVISRDSYQKLKEIHFIP